MNFLDFWEFLNILVCFHSTINSLILKDHRKFDSLWCDPLSENWKTLYCLNTFSYEFRFSVAFFSSSQRGNNAPRCHFRVTSIRQRFSQVQKSCTDWWQDSVNTPGEHAKTNNYIFWPDSANSVVSLNMWFQMWPAQLRFRNRSDSPSVMRCLWEYCAARDFSRLWSGPVSTAEFSNHVNICITALKNSDEKPTSWDTNR